MTKKLSKIGNLLDISKDFPIDADHFWSKVDRSGECWEWVGGLNTAGYGSYRVRTPDARYAVTGRINTQLPAHRVAYYLGHGELSTEHQVMHQCDNRKFCNPKHLILGTAQDNMDDLKIKRAHGVQASHKNPERSRKNKKRQFRFGPERDYAN